MLTTTLRLPADASRSRSDGHLLIRKIGQFAPLAADSRQALERCLSARVQTVGRGIAVIDAGEVPTDIFIVLEGWACSVRPTVEGRSSIVALHMPGDICDLSALMKRHMDCSILALHQLKVAALSRSAIGKLTHDHPSCAHAFWWEAMCASAIRGQWIARGANGSAKGRVANLLCELAVRLYVVGLADDTGFELPLTQSDLGNSCGLTPEHTNRVVRDLRAGGVIAWEKGRLTLLDWTALSEIGNFDPSYLHFRDLKGPDAPAPTAFAGAAALPVETRRSGLSF